MSFSIIENRLSAEQTNRWFESMNSCIDESTNIFSISSSQDKSNYKLILPLLLHSFNEDRGDMKLPSEFLEKIWEKSPALLRKHVNLSSANQLMCSIFSKNVLFDLVDKIEIPYLNNMSIMKYCNNSRKEYEPKSTICKRAAIQKVLQQSYSIQFFQPQRFNEAVYKIISSFEYHFGTLAGCSVYLTPCNSQGLAPHYDDIEAFIIQTEGVKRWKLWKNSIELPEVYSDDIRREELTKDFIEVVLYPGDMLYLPRGTIHEAIAVENEYSTHITISIYQKYNYKTLINELLPKLTENVFLKDNMKDLRRGLPINIHEKLGSFNGKINNMSEAIVESRRNFCNTIKSMLQGIIQELDVTVIDKTIDTLMHDFVMHRIPPPDLLSSNTTETESFEEQNIKKRKKSNNVRLDDGTNILICDKKTFHCIVQDFSGVQLLALAHSRFNSRECHMGHPAIANHEGSDTESINSTSENIHDDTSSEFDDLYSFRLPYRFIPIIVSLLDSYDSGGITLLELFKKVQVFNISMNEVSFIVYLLLFALFIELLNKFYRLRIQLLN